jgi:hypothetical protein
MMRKLILAWLAATLSIAGCIAYNQATKEVPAPTTYEQVCEVMEARYEQPLCEGLPAPTVVVTQLVPMGYNGLYFEGETAILIATHREESLEHVVIHETVHYIMYWRDLPRTRCSGEGVAREVTAQVTGVPEEPHWRDWYGC